MSKLQKRGYVINTAVLVVLFALFMLISGSLGGTDSFKLILVPSIWLCCYLIILAASLNLVLGFLGQLSLGHCGFMAIGAYTAALMSLAFQRAGVYDEKSGAVFIAIIFLCIIAAGLLAAVIGAVVSIPALRLKGDYLAIITLGFGLIIVNVINNLPFAGQNGLAEGSASASLYATGLGFGTAAKVTYIWVALLVTIVCIVLMFMFIRSKYGRAIRAIRNDEIAASAAGMNPTETAELLSVINTIRGRFGIAILLIEHDMSLVMNVCQRIQVIDYGQTIASGLPAEIASNPRVIAAYLGE